MLGEIAENEALTNRDGSFEVPAVRRWQVVTLGGDRATRAYTLRARASGYDEWQRSWWEGDDRPQVIELVRRP